MEPQKETRLDDERNEIIEYGDTKVASYDVKVPRWLHATYIFWIIVGLFWWYFYFNGSHGWLDRGYWQQLQRAANTTFPQENFDDMSAAQLRKLEEEQKN